MKPEKTCLGERLVNGDAENKATLTALFSDVAKHTPAVIIPEGDQRYFSYAQVYEDVTSFQRELACQ